LKGGWGEGKSGLERRGETRKVVPRVEGSIIGGWGFLFGLRKGGDKIREKGMERRSKMSERGKVFSTT